MISSTIKVVHKHLPLTMGDYTIGRDRTKKASTIVPESTSEYLQKGDELYVADHHSQDIEIKPIKPAPRVGGKKKLAGKKPASVPVMRQTQNPFIEAQRQEALQRRIIELAADKTYSTD